MSVVGSFFKNSQEEEVIEIKNIELPVEKSEIASEVEVVQESVDDLPIEIHTVEEKQIVLPLLNESDSFFKEELALVSNDLLNWFQTENVIKKYIYITNDLSQHQILFKHRSFLKPSAKFVVKKDARGLYLAEENYKRFDKLANTIAAIDIDKAVNFYMTFKPLFEQVYKTFSYPAGYTLDDIFKKAAASVISAPIIEDRIALKPHSIRYRFADDKLESLDDVKKQMIRMGPDNTRKIQNAARKLVQALTVLEE